MTTTCADAISANLEILRMNRAQKAEYNAKRDLAYDNWQSAKFNKSQAIADLDRALDIGHYILRNTNAYLPPNAGVPKEWVDRKFVNNFWNTHVAHRGNLESCPSGSFGGCCGSFGSSEADRKCCSLGKERSCNPCAGGDCGGWERGSEDPFNEFAGHNRLRDNLFLPDIEKTVDDNIQNLLEILNAMKEPEPFPGFNIACCQDISVVGEATDESNIIFDTVTNTCTVNDTGEFIPVPPIINSRKPGSDNTDNTNNTNNTVSSRIRATFSAFYDNNLSPKVQENEPEKFYGTAVGVAIGIAAFLIAFFFTIKAIVDDYKLKKNLQRMTNYPQQIISQTNTTQFGKKRIKKYIK